MKDSCKECPTGRTGFEVAETDFLLLVDVVTIVIVFMSYGTYGFVKVKLTECPPAHQCFKSKSLLGIRYFMPRKYVDYALQENLVCVVRLSKILLTNYQENKKLYIDTLCVSSCPAGKYAREILLSTRSHYDTIEDYERNDTSQLICEDCPAGKKGEMQLLLHFMHSRKIPVDDRPNKLFRMSKKYLFVTSREGMPFLRSWLRCI